MPNGAGKPLGALLILEGRDAGKLVVLEKVPFTLGRLHECDFVLSDELVSRHHARIEMSAGKLLFTDLKSRNGTLINDVRQERHILTPGDRIQIGTTVMVFQSDVNQARDILAASIPDSPSFAMGRSSWDEPTSVRFLDSISPQESAGGDGGLGIEQVAKLFNAVLPPQGVASQILDIFFQSYSPDRAQLAWEDDPPLHLARSRKEGKKGKVFPLSPELMGKTEKGAVAVQEVVPAGQGTEKRWVILAPLFREQQRKGWIYGDRGRDQPGFPSNAAVGLQAFSLVAGGVLERASILSESRKMREQMLLMEKHLSPAVVRMLSAKGVRIDESALTVEEREVTVLFSDIQGFTPLSERLSPAEIAQLLNEYFQRMVDVIMMRHGTLNKFIGDAVMALFGAPESHGNDAANAVAAGLDMVEALKRFWLEIDERKRFNIRVGINTGRVVAGNIGSEKKMEYTVLGDAVNVASRLEGVSLPNSVTIGARTAELVKDSFRLEKVPNVKVKGKSQEMDVYRVLSAI